MVLLSSASVTLEMELPTAIALTWDSTTVRVRCPYTCPKGIHIHGYTSPHSSGRNTRVPHCTPEKDDNGQYVFSRDYRILFPFEEDADTEGMWWEVDYHKKRWRTVSWKMYDPEYWEPRDGPKPQFDSDRSNELGSQTSEEDETGIENAFSSLTVNDRETRIKDGARYESESPATVRDATSSRTALSERTASTDEIRNPLFDLFDSLCLSNLLEEARKLSFKAANVKDLVNGKRLPDGKPLLLTVVEEGHEDVVEFLLNHEAMLESHDRGGNTALLRALHFERGVLAERLIVAGANTNVSNHDDKTVCDVARTSLERQKESIRIETAMIHPQETSSNSDQLQQRPHTEEYQCTKEGGHSALANH